MHQLFGDLLAQAPPATADALARAQGAHVVGLQYGPSGPLVSVLVSKAAGRYRVQSDCFHAMWLVVQELQQRLATHFRAADAKPGAPPPPPEGQLVVSLQEPLPLQVRAGAQAVPRVCACTRQQGRQQALLTGGQHTPGAHMSLCTAGLVPSTPPPRPGRV